MRILKIIYAVIFCAIAMPLSAQEVGNIDITTTETNVDAPLLTISVTGEAKERPDIAMVIGAVKTTNLVASEAMGENNRTMRKIIASLRKQGVAPADMQTSTISLRQEYENEDDYYAAYYAGAAAAAAVEGVAAAVGDAAAAVGDIDEPKKKRIKVYAARNSLSIRIRDIDKAGKIIDALVTSGASSINGPNFSIEDNSAMIVAARKQAIEKAKARSAQYARETGYGSAQLISITDVGSRGGRVYDVYEAEQSFGLMQAMAGDSSTPFEPGMVTLGVRIMFKYRLVK